MTHLEHLLAEYHQWQGRIVKCGTLVGKRERGGHEMELDIVSYHPTPRALCAVTFARPVTWEFPYPDMNSAKLNLAAFDS